MNALAQWKHAKKRNPLILKGARQVGKTHLLKAFGKTHFPAVHYLNFEKQSNLANLFEADLDPDRLIREFAFLLKTDINSNEDLLIFDEIQACPKALTALKYFQEEKPEQAICAAGSLLGIHLNQGSFPVGKVDWLNLYPMSFREFLEAGEETLLINLLNDVTLNTTIPEIAHQQLWEQLKYYFITGGLPEVVSIYYDNKMSPYTAFNLVREKQEKLLRDYCADIAKHAGKINAMHIDRLWQSVPTQLANSHDAKTHKFKFKGIVPGIDRYSRLANVIDWLSNTNLILKVHLTNRCEHPLKAYTKDSQFKLLMFDVGLLGCMSNLAPDTLLKYDYGSYKGYFAENFVAQELMAQDSKPLFCWQDQQSEVEFIKDIRGDLIPIEVKAGHVTHAKSLQQYETKYHPNYSVILSAKPKMHGTKHQRHFLPLYLAGQLLDILDT